MEPGIGMERPEPVPADLTGRILNGAHRIACAIALGIPQIAVLRVEPPESILSFRTVRNILPDGLSTAPGILHAMNGDCRWTFSNAFQICNLYIGERTSFCRVGPKSR